MGGGNMLLDYKIKNYKTFNDEVEISLKADMHIKKFMSNTITVDKWRIVKLLNVFMIASNIVYGIKAAIKAIIEYFKLINLYSISILSYLI